MSAQRVFDPRQFGPRLRALRTSRGMSQRQLLKSAGLANTSCIAMWERGRGLPSMQSIALLALTLDVSADELIFGG